MSGESYEPCLAESGFCSNTTVTLATDPGRSDACIILKRRQNIPKLTKPGLIEMGQHRRGKSEAVLGPKWNLFSTSSPLQ